jgi:thioredoxin-like negative regulator of GroEL
MAFGRKDIESPNLEHLLQLGIRAAREGNFDNARVMFQQVLDNDKRNERAWLLMAKIAPNEVEKLRLLETVLEINPRNEEAIREKRALQQVVMNAEGNSMSFGIRLLVVAVLVIVVVAVLVIIIT